MAHILIHTLVFAPDGDSTSVIMTELALELQAKGHTVTVLTTQPHTRPDAEAQQRQALTPLWGGIMFRSDLQGIKVFHTFMRRKGSGIRARLVDYARFHIVSLLAGLGMTGDYDMVIAPSPPLTIGVVAWLLARIRRVPFVYNVQEIYPDVLVSLDVLHNAWAIRGLEWLERFVYARSRVIVVISEAFRRRLLEKGVPQRKLWVIPNFVDTEFVQPGPRRNAFSTANNLDDRFVVLYAGNIGLTQGFETILAAARQLAHMPDIQFVINGYGTRWDWLQQQIAADDLTNVMLLPYQPRSMVPLVYATSDVCLVPLKRGTAGETFPSKIYTIMAAGRPVIASADPDTELDTIVHESGSGWTVPPDDVTALVQTVQIAYNNRDELQRKGQQARTYVSMHHSRRAVADEYDTLIRHVTKT